MLQRAFSISILALLSLGLAACGGGGGGSGFGGGTGTDTTGTLNVSVTDAPVDDANRVLVQFTGIAVKPKQGEAIEIPLHGDSQTCRNLLDGIPPAPTPSGEATVRCVDLLAFQGNRRAQLLQGEELEAGEYTWMRLDVDARRGVLDSIIVLNDGSAESLYIPSGDQSGLKLNTSFNITAGEEHNFVIDFDLRKSLNKPRGFPDYMLKPSLRLVNISDSGTISGTVEASLLTANRCTPNAYAVYVYQGRNAVVGEEGSDDPPAASAGVVLNPDSGDWGYSAAFLPPGDYTVVFTCEAGNDSSEEADDGIEFVSSADSPATVVSGKTSTVDFGPIDN
jgi:Domain of unknown function (DUF4382)